MVIVISTQMIRVLSHPNTKHNESALLACLSIGRIKAVMLTALIELLNGSRTQRIDMSGNTSSTLNALEQEAISEFSAAYVSCHYLYSIIEVHCYAVMLLDTLPSLVQVGIFCHIVKCAG